MPATLYLARDDDAVKNASYVMKIQPRATSRPTFVRYTLGDFAGYVHEEPTGLTAYTAAQVRRLQGKR